MECKEANKRYKTTQTERVIILPKRASIRSLNTTNQNFELSEGDCLVIIATASDTSTTYFIQLVTPNGDFSYTIPIATDGTPTKIYMPEAISVIAPSKSGAGTVNVVYWREDGETQIKPGFDTAGKPGAFLG